MRAKPQTVYAHITNAMTVKLRPLQAVAEEATLPADAIIQWGRDRAKIELSALSASQRQGKLVLVSAINPTPAGEGKTTTSVALSMGLRKRGVRAIAALREPSLGPVFGVKGGGTGGGVASLEPAAEINLHFTGDIHAISCAHNLLSALIDNAVYFKDPVEIDGRLVRWRRTMDMNDRFLRNVMVGLGGKANGVPRETSFDITAASEVMAIFCLAESFEDLQRRCERIVIATRPDGSAIRAHELFAAPSMVALLKDALMPNLVQTREGGPAIVHGGPFANIAHGCNSVLATRMALAYGEVVITEAGFGFDLGAEKFLDIKCRSAGLWPHGLVLVVTLRALKMHGGCKLDQSALPNMEALKKGFDHLQKHLETAKFYGLSTVVSVNRFPADSEQELEELRAFGRANNVEVAVCEGFAKGGEGSLELADAVLNALKNSPEKPEPRFAYALEDDPAKKIEAIARTVYGADGVVFTASAQKELMAAIKLGGATLPVCMAKTHLSLSDDATRVGRPKGFQITVREVRLSAGAGYLVALTGELLTMPGLPREPAARRVTVHPDGKITGLMQGE